MSQIDARDQEYSYEQVLALVGKLCRVTLSYDLGHFTPVGGCDVMTFTSELVHMEKHDFWYNLLFRNGVQMESVVAYAFTDGTITEVT